MPKDSTPTRLAILAAAQQALKRGGLDDFSIETVARRAGVAKGLVLYHYGSRRRLLQRCGAELASERVRRLHQALASSQGAAGVDAVWDELLRQEADGTARAWLGLAAAGYAPIAGAQDFEARARATILDGCAAALAANGNPEDLRDAFNAMWLALLEVVE
jgi:AcrR family transcriptional regulator